MKIKLDENLPSRLAQALSGLGHDVDTVVNEGLTGKADPEVWKATQSAGRFLITQDLDFSDTRKFTPGTHRGLLIVRLHNPGRQRLLRRIQSIFRIEDVSRWDRCFVVLTDSKLRVIRPAGA